MKHTRTKIWNQHVGLSTAKLMVRGETEDVQKSPRKSEVSSIEKEGFKDENTFRFVSSVYGIYGIPSVT